MTMLDTPSQYLPAVRFSPSSAVRWFVRIPPFPCFAST